MKALQVFRNGLIDENPIFFQLLGMCPTLAVTTSAQNAIGMGLASTAVLVGSNAVISLIKKFIPAKIRIPAFIVVIATFVTIIQMVLEAYFYGLFKSLGIFIPLIVVNCIILARAESFASKNKVVPSIVDGLGMGLGFTLALFVLGATREIIGNGAIFDVALFGENFEPVTVIAQSPGAFLALGLILGLINFVGAKRKKALAK
jgi:Na+-translocating ferredoxin:NAD+ oxidoreductase subunit E